MTAMGQANALAVLAVGDKGSFLKAPDMYMEKLIVGPKAKGAIDLDQALELNLKAVAKALGKPLSRLTVITLPSRVTTRRSRRCRGWACGCSPFPTATWQPPSSPVCRTAKWTCCMASAAHRRG